MGVDEDVNSQKKAYRRRKSRFEVGKITLEKGKLKTRVRQPLADLSD